MIGGTTFMRETSAGWRPWPGLAPPRPTRPPVSWIQFSTDDTDFSVVVAGVRSGIWQEFALKGPLKLKPPDTEWTATRSRPSKAPRRWAQVDTSRPLRPGRRTHVPVEEDSLNAKGNAPRLSTLLFDPGVKLCVPRRRRPAYSIGNTTPSERSAPRTAEARRNARNALKRPETPEYSSPPDSSSPLTREMMKQLTGPVRAIQDATGPRH